MVDYNKILTDYNVCTQVNSGAVDELWLWGAPYFGYYESVMAGPGAFWINGPVITNTTCQKKLPIMGFNYERLTIEMMHSLGHRAENSIANIFGGWQANLNTAWNRFALADKNMSGKSSCGSVHIPPNGTRDYDYGNRLYVNSRCDDWLNYPSTKGLANSINCTGWNCNGSGIDISGDYYEKWWLTHLPFSTGTTNNKLNNWWAYIVDYDNAITKAPTESEKWFALENGNNDYNSSCSIATGANEIYFGVNSSCSPTKNYTATFTFPMVQMAGKVIVSQSYLEFVADGPYTNPITENITLSDGTTTTSPISWTINDTWTSQTIVRSPDMTTAVQQLLNNSSWSSGKTITVSINHVSGTGNRRVFAVEREAMAGARLIIKLKSTTPSTITCGGLAGKSCPTGMQCVYSSDGTKRMPYPDELGLCI